MALRLVQEVEFVQVLTVGQKVTVHVPDMAVLIDPTLCGLILNNAIGNSSKHGDPRSPTVQLAVTIAPFEAADGIRKMLEVIVTNRDHPHHQGIREASADARGPEGPATSAISNYIGLRHSFMVAKAGG